MNVIKPTRPAARESILSWVTPDIRDLVFYEVKDRTLPLSKTIEMGDPHPDKARWPHHEVVGFSSEDDEGKNVFRVFYAARRSNQDLYNYEIGDNDMLTRTYLVKRSDYVSRGEDPADPTTFDPHFPAPVGGTPDVRFSAYKFFNESVSRAGEPLDGLFIVVRRTFLRSPVVAYPYDDELERTLKVTRTVVPAGTVVGSTANGVLVEVQPQNIHADITVQTELAGGAEDLGQLTTVPGYVDYRFPAVATKIEVVGAYAYAISSGHAPSFSQDFFVQVAYSYPAPGPYKARIERHLTDDPDSVVANLDQVQLSRAEFGMLSAWYYSSTETGNQTSAIARKMGFDVPCIHGPLALPSVINYNNSQSTSPDNPPSAFNSGDLSASPGWPGPLNHNDWTAAVTTKKTKLGLFVVSVAKIQMAGIYEAGLIT